ncbi:LOW QUALITY PROTEIN: sialic acid-binding Ig-like lectin 14, partial [Carlito syrichta]|uniref:LOW QUALITY PROTEIN: sialic acid-binding Ig-like lectin 14 n=1 Tax=Carlito syrichta TaxID=1868482 RepID=A0A1U7SW31_CARSF
MLSLLLLPLLWRGSLQETPGYRLEVPKSVTVQEGLCVFVPCSFFYPQKYRHSYGQLYGYWFLDGENSYYRAAVATNNPDKAVKTETRGRFRLLGDIGTNNCSLGIKNARMTDSGSYYFQMEKGQNFQYKDNKLNLQVTALTEKPDIQFPEPLESSRPTELSCSLAGSCKGGQPLTFSWTGQALDSLDAEILHSSVLTLIPRPQDHNTNLTCQVKLQGAQVTTERTVLLNVS